MSFRAGKINGVQLSQPTTLSFNGKDYTVAAGSGKSSDIVLLTDKIVSFNSGSGNSMELQGQTIAFKPGTLVRVSNGETIDKFFVAEPVTVTVYKKKEKVVDVKPGKKIVLKDGKIVKAG